MISAVTARCVLPAAWGPCADFHDRAVDLNGDCSVAVTDLLALLANWG